MDEQTMGNEAAYRVIPIGRVQLAEDGAHILIDAPYRAGLKQLDQFSHAYVLWWATAHDNPRDRGTLVTVLPYAPGEEAGVFACRAPYRPNPIALTLCPLFAVDEAAGDVWVPWIDAEDGTPVLDLKPYVPLSDRAREVQVARWFAGWPGYMEDAADFDFAAAGLAE